MCVCVCVCVIVQHYRTSDDLFTLWAALQASAQHGANNNNNDQTKCWILTLDLMLDHIQRVCETRGNEMAMRLHKFVNTRRVFIEGEV
jgi:hypothetical protein